jgi:hypothetical protein
MAIALPIISEWNPKGINKAIADFKKLGTTGEKAAFAIKKAALPAAAALVAIGATAVSAIKAGEAFATANARVANIADSMGLFGTETKVVTDRLLTLAEATARQIGVDNLSIKATQAKLLTFKNLAATADEVGSSFDRATMAALDMASAGFGSAEQNAVQLGKALEDPIKGITALAKSGITFTASEKKKIEALVKSNKLLEAQDMILQAIEKQIGGTAKATANDTDKMKEGFRQFQQQLGSALLPVLAKITPLLTGLASWATKNKTAFIIIASVIGGIATAILATNAALAVYNTIQALTAALNGGLTASNAALATSTGAVTAATGAVTAATTAATASFSALWVATGAVVIIAIIAALVALQVKFDIFGKAVDGIKYAFDKLWGAIKFVFDWAKNNWPLLLAIITGPFGPAILAITTFKDQIMNVFSLIYNGIKATMGFIANVITAPFKAAFKSVAWLWNNTVGKLSFTVPSWVPLIGGKGFDVPDIPMLADGGIVTSAQLAVIGEAGPEAVIPLSKMGQFGVGGAGGMTITVNAGLVSTPDQIGQQIIEAILKAQRRSGQVFASA